MNFIQRLKVFNPDYERDLRNIGKRKDSSSIISEKKHLEKPGRQTTQKKTIKTRNETKSQSEAKIEPKSNIKTSPPRPKIEEAQIISVQISSPKAPISPNKHEPILIQPSPPQEFQRSAKERTKLLFVLHKINALVEKSVVAVPTTNITLSPKQEEKPEALPEKLSGDKSLGKPPETPPSVKILLETSKEIEQRFAEELVETIAEPENISPQKVEEKSKPQQIASDVVVAVQEREEKVASPEIKIPEIPVEEEVKAHMGGLESESVELYQEETRNEAIHEEEEQESSHVDEIEIENIYSFTEEGMIILISLRILRCLSLSRSTCTIRVIFIKVIL